MCGSCHLCKGVSVHWLGDFVFVESGLGVRVKFDLSNTIYVTVTAEHLAATRGLCGIYNNDASGRPTCNNFVVVLVAILHWGLKGNHKQNQNIFVLAQDDFTTMSGHLSQYAASFGNSWKVPDQKNEVISTLEFLKAQLTQLFHAILPTTQLTIKPHSQTYMSVSIHRAATMRPSLVTVVMFLPTRPCGNGRSRSAIGCLRSHLFTAIAV